MPTFGFSAYLKLICLNSKPQIREIRNRITPKDGGGYDFHRSLQLLSRKYLLGKENEEQLIRSTMGIVKVPERKSARFGLQQLFDWSKKNPGPYFDFSPAIFKSPDGVFNIKFLPSFGAKIDGKSTAIHIWNTKEPKLAPKLCYSALALFPKIYAGQDGAPDDLGVLSLRDGTLYLLSEAGDVADFGQSVVKTIENLFHLEARDLGLTISPPKHDPHAPPSPPS